MLVFFIKQMLSLKRAILGRREPHQLAWGLALGVWLGIVPYGNLVALAILLLILSVRVNHGMVAVTAVATSVIAALLDAQTHAVGKYVLTHPHFAPQLSTAWQWLLVPWTDINNTVVMGGLLLGLAAVVPTYLLSYPLFRYLAPPAPEPACEDTEQPSEHGAAVAGDEPPAAVVAPTALPAAAVLVGPAETGGALILRPLDTAETTAIDAACGDDAALGDAAACGDGGCAEPTADQPMVQTRIEVVRLVEVAADNQLATREPVLAEPAVAEPEQAVQEGSAQETLQADPPMSEALNYLLRQLRDSRQRRAA